MTVTVERRQGFTLRICIDMVPARPYLGLSNLTSDKPRARTPTFPRSTSSPDLGAKTGPSEGKRERGQSSGRVCGDSAHQDGEGDSDRARDSNPSTNEHAVGRARPRPRTRTCGGTRRQTSSEQSEPEAEAGGEAENERLRGSQWEEEWDRQWNSGRSASRNGSTAETRIRTGGPHVRGRRQSGMILHSGMSANTTLGGPDQEPIEGYLNFSAT